MQKLYYIFSTKLQNVTNGDLFVKFKPYLSEKEEISLKKRDTYFERVG